MSTRFFTNHGDQTLLRKFQGVFESNTDIEWFDALVGYLYASGYSKMSRPPHLDPLHHPCLPLLTPRPSGLPIWSCNRPRPGRSPLATWQISGRLRWYEMDRDNRALAAVKCRRTAADSLGAHSASGGFVHGLRAGTG
jgi:hypothetical protein